MLAVLLALIPVYYWYMLQPFYKKLGKESRRVAELLSQLPKSVDVLGKCIALFRPAALYATEYIAAVLPPIMCD